MHKGIRIAAALAMLALGGRGFPAHAQEYCVTCTGPSAVYRCIVGGGASSAARLSHGQLQCITELARSGGHESCSVGRTSLELCAGEQRTVMLPSTLEAPPPVEEAPWQVSEPVAEEPQPPAGPVAEEPVLSAPAQTAATPAEETAQTSENGLGDALSKSVQSAGSAVGNAAKKTWSCLSSLFSDC